MNDIWKQRIKYILTIIIYISIIVILSFAPNTGFIMYNYLTISLVSIVVILAAINHGYVIGSICGLVFGLCSFFVANDYNMNPLDAIYTNIFVAIIPRVFLGLACAFTYKTIIKILKTKWISSMISAVICLALMVIITFVLAYLLQTPILVDIYNETNPLYLFYQYLQYETLIETSLITIIVGIISLLYEYVFDKNQED